MHETATKPRNTSGEKRPTKEQIQALAMMKDAVAQMREFGEPVGTSWIMEHVQYCTSSQKATSLMRKAMNLNLVKKVDSVKGKVQYVVLQRIDLSKSLNCSSYFANDYKRLVVGPKFCHTMQKKIKRFFCISTVSSQFPKQTSLSRNTLWLSTIPVGMFVCFYIPYLLSL